MNKIERTESTITDIKDKFENQEEMTNQGFAYVYRIEQNNGEFNFREVWRRKLKGRAKCIYYNIVAELFIIGRTDSFISIHILDKEFKYKKVALAIIPKKLLSTITGIWFDSLETKVYSFSADKIFVASEIGSCIGNIHIL